MTEREMRAAARAELYAIRYTDAVINRLMDTVETLRCSLIYKGISYEGERVSGGDGVPDKNAETIAKIIDYEKEIEERIDQLVDMKHRAFRRISALPELREQNVLIARYIQLKTWDTIIDELEQAEKTVYELHRKALQSYAITNGLADAAKDSCTA